MELVLIRHGLPVRLEATDGPADPPLSEHGVRQATGLAHHLGPGEFDAVYTSPLLRARQTAEPLCAVTGVDATVVDDVAEWDRHASTYIPLEQIRVEKPEVIEAMASGRFDALGIDMDAFVTRVRTAMDVIAANHRGGRVAVVCHGGVINVYLAGILDLPRLLFFEPAYTSVSRVAIAGDGRRGVVSINETAHLRALPSV